MTTERDLLQEAMDELQAWCATYDRMPAQTAELLARIDSHLSQPESDEGRDARRYRWLRKHDAIGEIIGGNWVCGDGTRYADEYRDADIDAALSAPEPPK